MKKHSIIIILAAVLAVLPSCSGWLNQKDWNAISTEDIYSSEQGINSIVANLYSRLRYEQDFQTDSESYDLCRWDEATNYSQYWTSSGNVGIDYRSYYDYTLVREVNLHIEALTMIDMASKGLRVMNICVAVVGFNIVAGNLFQCLGMVRTAIVLSLSRQLLCLLPFLYLLPLWLGVKGVWLSFPVADLISTVMAAIFVVRLMRKFDRLKDGDDSSILGSAIK